MSKIRLKFKKILAFILTLVLLFISVPMSAKADDFNYMTSEYTLTIDGIEYKHHSDGTTDIMNKDGTINKTLSYSETEHKFSQLGLRVDEYGNWSYADDSFNGFFNTVAQWCSLFLGVVGDSTGYSNITSALADAINDDLATPLSYYYMTDQDVTLDSDQLSDIYDKLSEMLREQKGLVPVMGPISNAEWDQATAIASFNNGIGGGGDFTKHFLQAVEYLKEQGCTAFYANYWVLYGFDTSDLAYHTQYGYDPIVWIDSECNQLEDAYCYYVDFTQFKKNGWVLDETSTGTTDCSGFGYSVFAKHIGNTDVYYLYKSYEAAYNDIIGGLGIYTTTNFDNGDLPTSITLSPTDLEINWDDLMDELSTELDKQTSGITDKLEKQEKIDETISKYLKDVKKDVASIEDNTKDMSKDIDSILAYLKKMYKRMDDFYDDMTKDALKGIQKSLDTLNSSIKSIGKDVSTIKTLTEVDTLIDTLNTLTDGSGGSSSPIKDSFTEVGETLGVAKEKFPFCVLWDVALLFGLLAADPVAPQFTMVFDLPQFGLHEEFVVDLSMFGDVSEFCRTLQSLLFILCLVNLTRKMFLDGRNWL